MRQAAIPLPVVVNELVNVGAFVELAEEEVMQHSVVQDGDSGAFDRAPTDGGMQAVVAEGVEVDIGV